MKFDISFDRLRIEIEKKNDKQIIFANKPNLQLLKNKQTHFCQKKSRIVVSGLVA
mgnify:CR=1 FL=1